MNAGPGQEMGLSTDSLAFIFNNVPYAVCVSDPEGFMLWVNDSWSEMWSVPRDIIEAKLIGKYNQFTDPQVKQLGILDAMKDVLLGEPVVVPQFLFDPKESGRPGQARWIELTLVPIFEGDQIKFVVSTYLDLTERLRLQHRLQESLSSQTFLNEAGKVIALESAYPEAVAAYVKFLAGHKYDLCLASIDSPNLGQEIFLANRKGIANKRERESFFKDFPIASLGSTLGSTEAAGPVTAVSGVFTGLRVPLKVDGKARGDLVLLNIAGKDASSDNEFLAKALASRLSLALENFTLLNRLAREVELRESLMETASKELKAPLQELLAATHSLTDNLKEPVREDIQKEALQKKNFALTQSSFKQTETLVDLVDDMLDITRIRSGHLRSNPSRYRLKEQFDDLDPDQTLGEDRLRFEVDEEVEVIWDRAQIDKLLNKMLALAAAESGEGKKLLFSAKNSQDGVEIILKTSDACCEPIENAEQELASSAHVGLNILAEIADLHGGTLKNAMLNKEFCIGLHIPFGKDPR